MSAGPRRRRRHRHASLGNRLVAAIGIGESRMRAIVLITTLAVVLAAAAVAVQSGSTVGPSAPPGSVGPTVTIRPPAAGASLPVVATIGPTASPSAQVAIVARRIRIAPLGIDLRIVEGDGIDAPMNRAAHYPGTGWPGGGTNIYIYGHAQPGMFLKLWDAQVGDEVVLDLIDGSSRTYVITVVKPRVPWNALEYLAPTPTEQLTIQTSTSNTATAPRFLVIAEPAT